MKTPDIRKVSLTFTVFALTLVLSACGQGPEPATTTAEGLVIEDLIDGEGEEARTSSAVAVHYTGWRAEDGEPFDSTQARGGPATLPLDGVIPGYREGLMLMVEGERRRLWIPPELAYRDRDGPSGMLVYDVELVRIQ